MQVHPNDEQAQALEGQPRGKAECWLVVSCQPGAELILGHTAASGAELRDSMLAGHAHVTHLTHVHGAAGRLLHGRRRRGALPRTGLLVYEVQQSSDITYRLYDFDRTGLDGQPRELHVEKGFSVVIPHDPQAAKTAGPWQDLPSRSRRRTLVECPQFQVSRWESLHGELRRWRRRATG